MVSVSGNLAVRGSESHGALAPNTERLARIFTDNYQLAWRILRRFGVEPGAVEDAAQQVFLIVAERLDDIRLGAERSFVYGTAMRVATSHRRRAAREVAEETFEHHRSPLPTPSELADRRRALRVLDAALEQMTDDLRRVFVLRELEGMTTPEIAELEEIPLGTAASRLRRARESFRGFVKQIEESSGVAHG